MWLNSISIDREGWIHNPDLQRLLSVLSEDGEQALIVGGAVRNALLGYPVSDIDIAVTSRPERVIDLCVVSGFKVIPKRLDHGVVTVICDESSYDVTTLREDIKTDGRHVEAVCFGGDWKRDAERRDFTINALYAHANGRIFDPIGGFSDLQHRIIRFIGEPEKRISEDYLRILRFFRFFACYGVGSPDRKSLQACFVMQDGLRRLSSERIWSEIKKIFSSRNLFPAFLWMKKSGILNIILGIPSGGNNFLQALLSAERYFFWEPDPLLRLATIMPNNASYVLSVLKKMKVSGLEQKRLIKCTNQNPLSSSTPLKDIAKLLYYEDYNIALDRLKLGAALIFSFPDHRDRVDGLSNFERFFEYAHSWKKPIFPLTGLDLISAGKSPGPSMGFLLRALEKEWVDSCFSLSREDLLRKIAFLLEE